MESNCEIFLDLDETLVHFISHKASIKRTKIEFDGEKYYGFQRPLAYEIILNCRSLAPTKILTAATRDYALKINEVFDFGFSEKHIFTREDLDDCILSDYKSKISKDDQISVLIDNETHDHQYSKIKMKSLGISTESYFQIRSFKGRDPKKFETEWDELFQKIKSYLKR